VKKDDYQAFAIAGGIIAFFFLAKDPLSKAVSSVSNFLSSKYKLQSVDTRLAKIVEAANAVMPLAVIEGHRGQLAQDADFAAGLSKNKWPTGRHNAFPSFAVDIAPVPIDWKNIERFKQLGQVMKNVARQLGVTIRWGADWNRNNVIGEPGENDYVHFEIPR
jgi:peptidoglycan L-alanyl-D-glutamate endopeptidase CwlK